jgi:hypothetical protein
MDLGNKIISIYPELTFNDFDFFNGTILLRDDGDGVQYIAKWDYSKPLPDGMQIGKS